MLPLARSANVSALEQDGDVIVSVGDNSYDFILSPITAWVWRKADGRTDIARLAALASVDLGYPVDYETICCSLDCLAEAGLLQERVLPMAAARSDLMRRQLRAGRENTSERQNFAKSPTMRPVEANSDEQRREQEGKRQEEARKQEDGAKERDRKFREDQARREQEYLAREQANKEAERRNEQNYKEQEGKRRK